MNKIFAFLLFFFSFHGKGKKENKNNIDKILIFGVYENVTTFKAVDCQSFESALGSKATETVLKDKDKIREFMERIESAKPDTANYGIDVRQKIFVHYKSGKVDTICRDFYSSVFYYKGKYYTER